MFGTIFFGFSSTTPNRLIWHPMKFRLPDCSFASHTHPKRKTLPEAQRASKKGLEGHSPPSLQSPPSPKEILQKNFFARGTTDKGHYWLIESVTEVTFTVGSKFSHQTASRAFVRVVPDSHESSLHNITNRRTNIRIQSSDLLDTRIR